MVEADVHSLPPLYGFTAFEKSDPSRPALNHGGLLYISDD